MKRRENTAITLVIAVCIAFNVVTAALFNHRLQKIRKNIPYLLEKEKIRYFHLVDREGNVINHNTLHEDTPRLIFIFSTPCNPCNKNLPFWNSVAGIFKKKVKTIGIILDEPNSAFNFQERSHLNFPVFVPEDISRFRQEMRIHLNLAQTIFYADGVRYLQLGVLEPESVTTLCNVIKSHNRGE